MFVVYVLLLEKKRLYVGMTKMWRLQTRMEEHGDKKCWSTKWTGKYKVVSKLKVFQPMTFLQAKQFENQVCEALLQKYGLDSCRGGKWNMASEGASDKWWVPPHLQGTPCFTPLWLSLSECTFSQSLSCDPVLDSAQRLFQLVLSWRARTFLKRASSSQKTPSPLRCFS